MFSRRSAVSDEENALSQLARALSASGHEVLDLTQSNPTRARIPYAGEAILAELADPRALVYEPAPFGPLPARAAISADWARGGVQVSPERLILTASSSESYAFLFKLLCDPGDAVLVPSPSYPLFEHLARFEAVAPIAYPLGFDGAWFLDFELIRARMTPRTRAIVIVSPNNPTGHFLRRGELEQLGRLGLPLISDEVFGNYALRRPADAVASVLDTDESLVFALSGLSKRAALPQMKVGWIGVNGPRASVAGALARLELIADSYLSVATPSLAALPRLLALSVTTEQHIVARLRDNWQQLEARVAGTPLSVLPVEGGWYAVLRLPATASEEEWVLGLLRERRTLVQPGYFYDFEREPYCVVSLLTEPAVFAAGIERLCDYVTVNASGGGSDAPTSRARA